VSGTEARIDPAQGAAPNAPGEADTERGAVAAAPEQTVRAAAAPPRRPRRAGRAEAWLLGGGAVIIFFAAWQLVTAAHVFQALFLPGPGDVAKSLGTYVASDSFRVDIATSGEELGVGFGLSILVGVPMGLLIGWYRRLRYILDPFINFLYSTPRIALLPLLIIWFGIGLWSKVAIIFLSAVFPILINGAASIRNLDPALLHAARSFRASDAQIFRTVALPSSVPFLLAGLRLGLGHALVGVVVGEMVAATHGVGLMISQAGSTFQTARVFAGIVIIAGMGVILTALLQALERRFDAWRQ
jgi:NitT/TauT family transport system permease protein